MQYKLSENWKLEKFNHRKLVMPFCAAETEQDFASIRALLIETFGGTREADLVEVIRNSPNFIPELSMVAKEDEVPIGYVLFSRILIEGPLRMAGALALAPLAVTPKRQRQGIGSFLLQVGLSHCRRSGHGIVVVVGDPHYYQRQGFRRAGEFGLTPSLPFLDETFMVAELYPDAMKDVSGVVCYPAYFDGV